MLDADRGGYLEYSQGKGGERILEGPFELGGLTLSVPMPTPPFRQ